MLRIERLSKTFHRDGAPVAAVQDVCLDIPKGQMVGIIGRSGAGKSTLLRLLNRLIEPSAGRIGHDGENVTALSGRALRAWRAQCAMIFQQFNLVGRLDVMTNVMLGGMFRAGTVAKRAGQAPFGCPTAVSNHDDSDMRRQMPGKLPPFFVHIDLQSCLPEKE